jgi:hypothetical protein
VLSVADLAGSERADAATTDVQRVEGSNINRSLLALGNVISALADQKRPDQSSALAHINFRDSKLTRLLQPSLSGSGRLAVLACVHPAAAYAEETVGTLKFAARASRVRISAPVNEILDGASLISYQRAELDRARAEIDRLRASVVLAEDEAAAAAEGAAEAVESAELRVNAALARPTTADAGLQASPFLEPAAVQTYTTAVRVSSVATGTPYVFCDSAAVQADGLQLSVGAATQTDPAAPPGPSKRELELEEEAQALREQFAQVEDMLSGLVATHDTELEQLRAELQDAAAEAAGEQAAALLFSAEQAAGELRARITVLEADLVTARDAEADAMANAWAQHDLSEQLKAKVSGQMRQALEYTQELTSQLKQRDAAIAQRDALIAKLKARAG